MKSTGLTYNSRKALQVNIGEAAGTEIANLIGSSRETVCSILNQFRRSGWLEIERGRIRLVDRARLASVR